MQAARLERLDNKFPSMVLRPVDVPAGFIFEGIFQCLDSLQNKCRWYPVRHGAGKPHLQDRQTVGVSRVKVHHPVAFELVIHRGKELHQGVEAAPPPPPPVI